MSLNFIKMGWKNYVFNAPPYVFLRLLKFPFRVPVYRIAPTYLRVFSDGKMQYSARVNYDVACPMNFVNYPADTQAEMDTKFRKKFFFIWDSFHIVGRSFCHRPSRYTGQGGSELYLEKNIYVMIEILCLN
mgnify:CR=1 FL=1